MSLEMTAGPTSPGRVKLPSQLLGSWEAGLLVFMALLYLAGVLINPAFFGTTDAISAVLRDTARFGVMAVGMTFVIVNRDLDLSVGSTLGLVAVSFSIMFAPTHLNIDAGTAMVICLGLGLLVGLINGVLVAILRVPPFIATLTMLFIGRGVVLGLTGGKTIGYEIKARDYGFFAFGETNALGFNNQILIFLLFAVVGAVLLAKTRIGYETYATGGNDQAAQYAGINTRWVRIRAFMLSSFCAAVAGLMNVAQDKGVTSQYGQGAELIVIAAVIVGGASIAGGRGRVLGACLGAALVVLIDKVLREGVPTTRVIDVGGVKMEVAAMAQLPPGAVPAFLGLLLLGAVLLEPLVVRGNVLGRLKGWLLRRDVPPSHDSGGIAIVGVKTMGAASEARGVGVRGLRAFLHRRDAAAIILMVVLWTAGFWLRPDFWGSLDNSFNLLLAFTEIGLLSLGLTYVIANGDIDLSVGSVLALSGAVAAFTMKELGGDPATAVILALAAGVACGLFNGWLTAKIGMPAFVATLGMFYIARGLAAWLVSGRQLSGFPETYNLLGRNLSVVLESFGVHATGAFAAVARAVSVQTLFLAVVAILAAVVLGAMSFGQKVYATGGNERAASYAGINTQRVRLLSLVFSSLCAAAAGVIYVAYYRSFNPAAGQLRELDAIASVIIGGGSIFGGYGTIIGSLAGAAVITLIRALLSLQIFLSDGSSFVMPQHWMNVFIGLILLAAVIGDIWFRQNNILGEWKRRRQARAQARHDARAAGVAA
ncbi:MULTISPECIES: ABC transporter permease [unclassified Chelatococcus]|uniref:ABC transporter permease n=1 Tax=unclassified Chelatococcus TaxID=2638111 RepID=UPI001BD00EB3|nr:MULTISPECIES: ABC transporter permease [unclassified Chelatococcus]CAH1671721.1 Ribose transport system permease protein [Hyphomicrobiales bacterium]MBS7739043.1 ABC transporter permease [Chelatococcus sp. HY11]MBX3543478.1 ABC transporter permease [Chelatococcus sp.]MCO5076427.1 ABC transporter permease [Chelatococcus sp.]CAH1676073.1 Ribose transport system permease protein [Hyphomicrobiales bacterium]